MQLHQIKRNTKAKHKKRVGRGGKRGKTAGRGHKGQKAHGGHGIRPEMRDTIKKLPKRRGYRFKSIAEDAFPVNLDVLEKIFSEGDSVNPISLVKKGVVKKAKGKIPKIKILAKGTISKKIILSGCAVSESAKKQIEKAGGSLVNQEAKRL